MNARAFFISLTTTCLLLASQLGSAAPHTADKKTKQKPDPLKVEQINICAGERCMRADKAYSTEALLTQLHQLFKANEGGQIGFCKADKTTRECKKKKVCHFVMGGIIPGSGCANGISFHAPEVNLQTAEISMKADMPLTFIKTPLACTTAESSLSIRSANDIRLELKPHFCSWMAVGAMSAKFSFAVDFINLERGEIGGYWKHSVKGTGLGSGSGYLLLQFPNNIAWQALDTPVVGQVNPP
ncbi:MAG TPA: hypothetical protein VLC79_04310 [Cellvibrio sp.]|nr:hypothetical protein [Cellvibrio sp.]